MSTNDTSSTVALVPARAIRIDNGRGSIAYWHSSPRVYATQVRGYMTPEMARLIIEQTELLYQSAGLVHGFHDWFDMSNYDTACRTQLTAWVAARAMPPTSQHGRAP